jgi:metallo-beta-lactamase family protein
MPSAGSARCAGAAVSRRSSRFIPCSMRSMPSRFGHIAHYSTPLDLAPGIRAVFHDAGHILGSASILVEAAENGRHRRILFSGDRGNSGRPLLAAPSLPAAADVIVMEATYGDRHHRPYADSVQELYDAITETFARGGNG